MRQLYWVAPIPYNKIVSECFSIVFIHNSNMSSGRMFELKDFDGKAFTNAYAEERRLWEPLVEATQIKGDSETAPYLSPDDEFADFGTWDHLNGMGTGSHEDWMYAGEYVRAALGNGLAVERELGVNPFQFGLIGSTDSHTSLATADDDDFWGKFSRNEPHPGRATEPWAALEMPEGFAASLGVNLLQATLLYNRGVRDQGQAESYLSVDDRLRKDPNLLPDMERAVARVRQAVDSAETVGVCPALP